MKVLQVIVAVSIAGTQLGIAGKRARSNVSTEWGVRMSSDGSLRSYYSAIIHPGARTLGSQMDPPHGKNIDVYVDGACRDQRMGVGVVINRGQSIPEELALYVGQGSSHLAELHGVLEALKRIKQKERKRTIRIHLDSSSAIEQITNIHPAKEMRALLLIEDIRNLIDQFESVGFVKVEAHTDSDGNNRSDLLAIQAAARE